VPVTLAVCAKAPDDTINATIVAIIVFFIFAPQLYYFYRCWIYYIFTAASPKHKR
jgi:hypothetical protein